MFRSLFSTTYSFQGCIAHQGSILTRFTRTPHLCPSTNIGQVFTWLSPGFDICNSSKNFRMSSRRFQDDGSPGGKKTMTRVQAATAQREKYEKMPLEEKRKLYKCKSKYVTLDDVVTWSDAYKKNRDKLIKMARGSPRYPVNEELNARVSIWRGDITKLEIDSIVNAANNSLLGGGGVDGAIHSAAGSSLREECATLGGCDTGDSKLTGGHKLPAKYIIHTVGPIGEQESKLRRCYSKCLRLVKDHKLKSIAFPCISTGIYGYPNMPAAKLALETTRKWLEDEDNWKNVDRVVFCLFLDIDVGIYYQLMQSYFPAESPPDSDDSDASDGATATSKDKVTEKDLVKKPTKAEEKSDPTVTSGGDNEEMKVDNSKIKSQKEMEVKQKEELKSERMDADIKVETKCQEESTEDRNGGKTVEENKDTEIKTDSKMEGVSSGNEGEKETRDGKVSKDSASPSRSPKSKKKHLRSEETVASPESLPAPSQPPV